MIVDFQTHFTPRQIVERQAEPGKAVTVIYRHGIPVYSLHSRLYAVEERLRAMDEAGIDTSVLSSAGGWDAPLDDCRLVNDTLGRLAKEHPGRFVGLAHTPPLGGEAALAELRRGVQQLGLRGAAITAHIGDVTLEDARLDPFYATVAELDVPIFIHPALLPLGHEHLADFDLARSVGREFGLTLAVMRLIKGGVLRRFPGLRFVFAHLGGSIAGLLGRIRSFEDKSFWGTGGAETGPSFADQLALLRFDTAGFAGAINPTKAALLELPPEHILFGSDYPQEIRTGRELKGFIERLRALPLEKAQIDGILGGNAAKVLKLR